eukprot:TRINITY_DN6920_c0_g1_i2.p1 TRINITY_DN6920_c0_g1~~TRINITY_DN6920_c0_g1_i2.p1  ORF type:complete len:189 (-),score=25.54 TRINITY_DN6920_c0_g1_i2:85-651(-)
MMQRLLQNYIATLESHPIPVKSVTSGTLMGLGDLISQILYGKKEEKIQWMRTAQMVFFGVAASGPIYHYWYKFMERMIPGQTMKPVLTKLLVDQSVMAPTIITTFFFGMGLMQAKPLEDIYHKWRREIIPTLKGNYVLWPAATFIAYKYVPQTHRVAYISVVSLFWSIYLSHVNNREPQHQLSEITNE